MRKRYHVPSGVAARFLISCHGDAQRFRDWPGASTGDEGDLHMRHDDQLFAAHDLLIERDGCAFDLFRCGDDVEYIVHKSRLSEIDAHVAHHESETWRFLFGLLEQRTVVSTN